MKNEIFLENFMNIMVSNLSASLSQFLENQGFLASISSDNEIQVLLRPLKLSRTVYDQAFSVCIISYCFPSELCYLGHYILF